MNMDELQLASILEQAREFADEGKYLHALQLYRRVVEAVPSCDTGWMELAEVYTEMKQYDAAEKTLLEARTVATDKKEITFLLGNLNLKRERYDRALSFYRELLEDKTTLPSKMKAHLLFHVGLVHFYRNNMKVAEEYFRSVLRLDPRFPKIHESLGELLIRRGALAEAVSVLKTAIVHDPYSWIGHYLLGVAYMQMLDWRHAYDELVTAIEMDPSEPTAWQLCGEVLIALQQLDEAEQYLRKALELNPRSADAIAHFGQLYFKRGDLSRAREYFERALSLDPKNAAALRGKAQLRATINQQS
jgi:tetratricopeptide (TPR) repeat protein